jgi:hypothetical protein
MSNPPIVRLGLIFVIAIALIDATSCQQPPQVPDPAAQLQSIPAADPGKYAHMHDMKNWRNPYILIRADGVGLLDMADNAEIVLKPEELLPALAKLPATAWPYGRVIAVSANGIRGGSEQDGIAIRRNKGIVGGILEGAHIRVNWVPAA